VGSIDYTIDQQQRRAQIRFIGEVDGRMLQSAMERLWREFPEIAEYDSNCDMREFTGALGFDDIRTLSEAWKLFCGGRDRSRRTAVVSLDRYAPLYLKAIALCFAGRELAVFRSMDAAQLWLDRRD
jgi:hypothetical protein